MRISINKSFKSIHVLQEFKVPDLVVLTGKNGSGKSHLMEAISNHDCCDVFDDNGNHLNHIKYIPFNGLNPRVAENCHYLPLTEDIKREWENIKEYISEYETAKALSGKTIEEYVNSSVERKRFFGRWVDLVQGRIEDLTEDFFADNYVIVNDDFFLGRIASIFKMYQIHMFDNRYNRFLNETDGQHNKVLTDDEFVQRYGPKPWDLINELLSQAGLPYQVNHPELNKRELDFNLHLTEVNSGEEIHMNDLSTGEKVLMSLALSVYSIDNESVRPDVLLLDEPDAALHPEFSKVLMMAIEDYFVKEAKIKVVVSTHSPMTVALSPEESVYLMDKERNRPIKVTKQQAITTLTRNLDSVRLTFENRRQVFVESQFDVQYYNKIVACIFDPLPTVPQFLPPKSSKGSNCDEVNAIVCALRDLGNDLVYGIKDFDNKNHSSDFVLVLGEDKRYAIENYVFDPIYVAFLLIREGILKTNDIGLNSYKYVELSQLDDDSVQRLIDHVIKSLGLNSGNNVSYSVQSGKRFTATKEYFLEQGHDLEGRILDTWKPLHKYAQGNEGALKNHVIDSVWADYPGFISVDFIDLFKRIQ